MYLFLSAIFLPWYNIIQFKHSDPNSKRNVDFYRCVEKLVHIVYLSQSPLAGRDGGDARHVVVIGHALVLCVSAITVFNWLDFPNV